MKLSRFYTIGTFANVSKNIFILFYFILTDDKTNTDEEAETDNANIAVDNDNDNNNSNNNNNNDNNDDDNNNNPNNNNDDDKTDDETDDEAEESAVKVFKGPPTKVKVPKNDCRNIEQNTWCHTKVRFP